MVRLGFLVLVLSCMLFSSAHQSEDVNDVQADAKLRLEYLQKLAPGRRIVSCKATDGVLAKQRVDGRREHDFRAMQAKDSQETSKQQPFRDKPQDEAGRSNSIFQRLRMFVQNVRSGWNGPWRNDHKHDPSELPFSIDDLATGGMPRVDWGSYNLGNTLVLAPSVTSGPYFVSGEMVRQDLRSGQLGIPLYLDIQIININTCEPIPNAAVDLWQANATGIYSGVDTFGNGLRDPRNVQNQALRGIQVSDEEGSVRFHTIVPGHYWPRTAHIHVMTTLNAVIENSIVSGGNIAHIGQIYFDQELNDSIFQAYPYNANDQIRIRNRDDFLVIQGSVGGADPVAQYVRLGDKLSDGIFAWINFAIDPDQDYEVNPVTVCSEGQCTQNEQWWVKKLLLRLITFPNVYWRKPPVIDPVVPNKADKEHNFNAPPVDHIATKSKFSKDEI